MSESEPTGKQRSGLARAASLTPERRKEIAVNAANKRWGNSKVIRELLHALIKEYIEQFKDVPEVIPGLVEPLILWAMQLQEVDRSEAEIEDARSEAKLQRSIQSYLEIVLAEETQAHV